MANKTQVVYRNPKKTVRRVYCHGVGSIGAADAIFDLHSNSGGKATIMGYDLYLMIAPDSDVNEEAMWGNFTLQIADTASSADLKTLDIPVADDTERASCDKEIFEVVPFLIKKEGTIVLHLNSRKKRIVNKGDYVIGHAEMNATPAVGDVHLSIGGVFYLGE